MSEPKLKPCPCKICGRKPKITHGSDYTSVKCHRIVKGIIHSISTVWFMDDTDAINAWNTWNRRP